MILNYINNSIKKENLMSISHKEITKFVRYVDNLTSHKYKEKLFPSADINYCAGKVALAKRDFIYWWLSLDFGVRSRIAELVSERTDEC